MLDVAFLMAATTLVIFTLLPLWRHEAWWVRSLDFPRLQLSAISLLLIELVRTHAPDILVAMETDAWWQAQLDVLASEYPHTVKCPLDNLYGMHVYSKFELTDNRIEFLVASDVPSIHTRVTLPQGKRLQAHFLHPAPPSPLEDETSSERDAELIIAARSVAETNGS
jgi:endonuclease/exonuclease/phosphatase (EEP) superfamily protein YafD